jgi:glutaredoxin
MDIHKPIENIFTIYSKSDCMYCMNVELLMKNNSEDNCKYMKILCDEYIDDKNKRKEFLKFMEQFMDVSPKTFPIVFYDKQYIGGFQETEEFLKCKMLKFDEEF